MRSPPIRAIFFDAVGTLLHPEPPAPVVYAAAGRRWGSRLRPEEIAPRFRAAFQREEAVDGRNGLRTSEAREVERWRNIVGTVLDDATDPEACFRELFAHFSRPEAWRCTEETSPVLMELARRGYALGLASNYDSRLRSVAAGRPELQPVRHLLISSEVGWRKPATGFFTALCHHVALPPAEIALVGDDWDSDYLGARAAGLVPVFFAPQGGTTTADVVAIRQLHDLLALPAFDR